MAADSGASNGAGIDQWSCDACTFVNPNFAEVCEICGHAREASAKEGFVGLARNGEDTNPKVNPNKEGKKKRRRDGHRREAIEVIHITDSPPPVKQKQFAESSSLPSSFHPALPPPGTGRSGGIRAIPSAAFGVPPLLIDDSWQQDDAAGSKDMPPSACSSHLAESYPAISSRLNAHSSSRDSPSFNNWLGSPRGGNGPASATSGPPRPAQSDGTAVLQPRNGLSAQRGQVPARSTELAGKPCHASNGSSREPASSAGGNPRIFGANAAGARSEGASQGNQLLACLHAERAARAGRAASRGGGATLAAKAQVQEPKAATSSAETDAGKDQTISIMSYNVWFREDIALEGRMAAIGDLVVLHKPDVICLQEVTPNIYSIFRAATWWGLYTCSVSPLEAAARQYFVMQLSRLQVQKQSRRPFGNSIMGRELSMGTVEGKGGVAPLLVATSHLESPCPAPPLWNQMYSPERVAQAHEAFGVLQGAPDVVFCGDMNWDDAGDGAPPLPPGWRDAWTTLHPGKPGLTYDAVGNPMLGGGRLRKRLDRAFCHLASYELASMEIIGTRPIPGLTYEKPATVKKRPVVKTLPVLPSDHFGLVLKLRTKVRL